jgi:hypothetical protein
MIGITGTDDRNQPERVIGMGGIATQRAYCERMQLAVGTFAWWKHRLGSAGSRRRGPAATDHPEFVRVRVRDGGPTGSKMTGSSALPDRPSSEPPRPAPLEIVLPGDVIVRVYPECETSMLARVIGALGAGRC